MCVILTCSHLLLCVVETSQQQRESFYKLSALDQLVVLIVCPYYI